VQHPASLTHRPVEASAKPGAAIVRISIGLEHADDLTADIVAALAAAAPDGVRAGGRRAGGRAGRLIPRRDYPFRSRLPGTPGNLDRKCQSRRGG